MRHPPVGTGSPVFFRVTQEFSHAQPVFSPESRLLLYYAPMINSIQQTIKPHDKYQIESKLDYELAEAKQTRYSVSMYIFIPTTLGITKDTYSKADFYGDVQNYIRLKTPALILRDFTENSTSPLTTIERITTTENWAINLDYKIHLINNLKLLSAMLKSSIRDHFNLIEQRISEATPDSKIHLLIQNLVEEFLIETEKITGKYRSFYPVFNLPNVEAEIFTAYTLTDESLSLLVEESAVEMFSIVETYIKKTVQPEFKQQLNNRVRSETKHRKAHGYGSILNLDSDNEEYAFRSSVLKKYASSVLYLSTATHREGRGLEQLLFAAAAGLSMVFATVVAFIFQYRYGNFTFPFFVALVIGYMFKDRIKELGRAIFARYLQENLHDRKIIIRTQDGRHKLGILKEKVTFVKEKDIPKPVLRARNRDLITSLGNDGHAENIICYTKEIVLYATAFKQLFADVPQITGINDIIRYDIRAYLRKMAEPVRERHYLKDEKLYTVQSHKVYHLNLVSRYRTLHPERAKFHDRIRLVLDREGIKRIDHIPLNF